MGPREASARFLLREAAGALGDFGTFVPLAVGMVVVAGLDAGTLLVTAGVANIWGGLAFGIPIAAQPMKAICALAIAGALSGKQAVLAGLFVAVAMALLGLLGLIRSFARLVPDAVLRALQLTVACELLMSGLRFGFTGYSLSRDSRIALVALMGGALVALWLLRRRLEWAAIGLLAAGLGLAAWQTPALLSAPHLTLWRPQWMAFDRAALEGIWRAGLPQLPLTLLNSVLAMAALAGQLYPQQAQRLTPTRMALSVGFMNLLVCPLGGMPVCHGSGGLAGQYKLGARSGISVILLGLVKLCLGLLFGGAAVLWMKAFPRPVLGLFLLLAGWSLAEASRAWQTRAAIWVSATMVVANFASGSLLVGFAAGWLVWWWVRRGDKPVNGSVR
jgi:MFS superfamily sulfate permease-like transporter